MTLRGEFGSGSDMGGRCLKNLVSLKGLSSDQAGMDFSFDADAYQSPVWSLRGGRGGGRSNGELTLVEGSEHCASGFLPVYES